MLLLRGPDGLFDWLLPAICACWPFRKLLLEPQFDATGDLNPEACAILMDGLPVCLDKPDENALTEEGGV